ncbi:MAG: NAD(P)H-dependent oxidoreductase [Chromatiales bacterium]|jgi:FMN-dependent NADH-azoreductase|nr:NAD(P)H-dependent oxidoreductase [Chromatiales bacterium]MDH4030923.1 NAD(P)H-dependent oxidoreductase [Chromatiales bacterium]
MSTLLAINTSPMTRTAVTRRLVETFVSMWRERFPGGRVIPRDLGAAPPPHPDERMLTAFAKPDEALTAGERQLMTLSDTLVDELIAAHHIVIGSPMYNFTVTSGFKAWIDMVGRAGRTFDYGPDGPRGLLGGRQVFVLTARGGFYTNGSPEGQMDFQESFLRGYFGFLGIDDVRFIHAEGQGIDPGTAQDNEAAAMRELETLFAGDEVRRVA